MDLAGGTNTSTKQGFSIDGVCFSGLHEYLAAHSVMPMFIKKGQRVRIVKSESQDAPAQSNLSRMTFYGTL